MIVPGYVSNLPSVSIKEPKKLHTQKKQSQNKTKFLPHFIQVSIETETGD